MVRARKAPAIKPTRTLTVSTWGGVTQDSLKTYVQQEFQKQTGATVAFDIGGQGARFNKLLSQRINPPADIFFSTDEAVVAGHRAGILTPVQRAGVPNSRQLEDWSLTVKDFSTENTLPGIPYTLIAYILGFNPDTIKETPTSWADMWHPEYRGRLAFASPVHTQMPAFVIIASELAGGSVNNVDPGFRKLAELKPVKLTVFWTDWAPLDKTGDVALATEFDYYLQTMKQDKYPIAFAIPKEKGFASLEYASIVNGTKNSEIAEAFLNLLIDAKVQQAFATETYQTPVNKTVKLTDTQVSRCGCAAHVDQLRFFDPALFVEKRPLWTERMNTEVVPNWRT
jgi:putative spermidine/putrescine transport system substrate-binding protein